MISMSPHLNPVFYEIKKNSLEKMAWYALKLQVSSYQCQCFNFMVISIDI